MGSIGDSNTITRKANDVTIRNIDLDTSMGIISNRDGMQKKFLNSLSSGDRFRIVYSESSVDVTKTDSGYSVKESGLERNEYGGYSAYERPERTVSESTVRRYISNGQRIRRF